MIANHRRAAGMIAALLITSIATPAQAITLTPSVTPEIVTGANPGGNVTCAELGYRYSSARVNWNGGGFDASFPGGITVTTDGTYVSWTATFGISAVIVKGSNAANVYTYVPPSNGDSGLASPTNSSGKPAGLSNLTFCWNDREPGPQVEHLTVTKTADTSYVRRHLWNLTKAVDPDTLLLYANGTGDGTATWPVDVTYEGYEDSGWVVSGVIEVENDGDLDATVESIADVLVLDKSQDIAPDCDFDFPGTLLVGEGFTCSYSVDVDFEDDASVDGTNIATVETRVFAYSSDLVGVTWGEPSEEIDATVSVSDLSNLFGEQDLGEVTAPDDDSFAYDKAFVWADFGRSDCGDHTYDNIATLTGDDDEVLDTADASLLVRVQCFVLGGRETAWVANGGIALQKPYNKMTGGNWATYVEYTAGATKNSTVFAGRTINVGSSAIAPTGAPCPGGSKPTCISISLTGGWEFRDIAENLKVQDYSTAPSGNPAPGLFKWKKNCTAGATTCWIDVPTNKFYGIHLSVDRFVPDPNFP